MSLNGRTTAAGLHNKGLVDNNVVGLLLASAYIRAINSPPLSRSDPSQM